MKLAKTVKPLKQWSKQKRSATPNEPGQTFAYLYTSDTPNRAQRRAAGYRGPLPVGVGNKPAERVKP